MMPSDIDRLRELMVKHRDRAKREGWWPAKRIIELRWVGWSIEGCPFLNHNNLCHGKESSPDHGHSRTHPPGWCDIAAEFEEGSQLWARLSVEDTTKFKALAHGMGLVVIGEGKDIDRGTDRVQVGFP